jgi:hypothetical protein
MIKRIRFLGATITMRNISDYNVPYTLNTIPSKNYSVIKLMPEKDSKEICYCLYDGTRLLSRIIGYIATDNT